MNFWNHLESQKIIDREAIEQTLIQKLGSPTNQIQHNLLSELTKKITSYYTSDETQNHTTYSLFGSVQEIQEKKFKEGRNKGQTFYVLKLTTRESLQAKQENLPKDKWNQITKMALLGQNLVFKYKKWFSNKEVLDFYPQPKK